MPAATVSAYASAGLMLVFLTAAVGLCGWPLWGSVVLGAAAVLVVVVEFVVRRTVKEVGHVEAR